MAADIIARALAAKAATTAAGLAETYTSGFAFKGAVDYVSSLPDSGNSVGDIYLVRYSGSSGTNQLNARYAWGDDGGTDTWIPISVIPYTLAFNATSDWTALGGGGYAISVAVSAHNCGADARVAVWRENSGSYTMTYGAPTTGYTLTQDSDGDIRLAVDSADDRFAGKLVIS